MKGWVYDDPTWAAPSIWKFGYAPSHFEQAPDPKAVSTSLRDGNWDYVTNSVRWDRMPQTIPNSLYLSSKPSFFGSHSWPWVDPTGSTKLGTLPARERYEVWRKGR